MGERGKHIFVYEVDVEKLKDLIREKMFSVEELARKADINVLTIYSVLRKKTARGETIKKIARALDINPQELVVRN